MNGNIQTDSFPEVKRKLSINYLPILYKLYNQLFGQRHFCVLFVSARGKFSLYLSRHDDDTKLNLSV